MSGTGQKYPETEKSSRKRERIHLLVSHVTFYIQQTKLNLACSISYGGDKTVQVKHIELNCIVVLLNLWEESISEEFCKFKIMHFLLYFKSGATRFGSGRLCL